LITLPALPLALAPHQLDGERSVLIQHCIVEDDVPVLGRRNLADHVFPHEPRRNPLTTQVAIERIMRKLLRVIRKVRERIIDLTHQ
jgi:hypothetical protein